MSNSFESLLQVITGRSIIDSSVRRIAGTKVKQYFMELLATHSIENIPEEDVEELAFDLVDELALEDYNTIAN